MKRFLLFLAGSIFLVTPIASQQPSSKPPQQGESQDTKAHSNPRKKLLDDDLKGFDLSENKPVNVRTVVGGTRGIRPSVTLFAPKLAKLFGDSSLFQWSIEGHSEGYVFTILDEDESRIVREQLADPYYQLSTELSKLHPGEIYSWRVQVLPQPVANEGLKFTVVSAEERLQIENELDAIPAGDSYEAGLSRARIFVRHHLWFDAIGTYTSLIQRYPDQVQLFEDRGAIYLQLESTRSLGIADQERVRRLTAAQSK